MTKDGKPQGCINEGDDYRTLGWLFCPIQRVLSFELGLEPFRFVLYFPPHLYLGIPLPGARYLVLRAGWRHDRHWGEQGGYIFDVSLKMSRGVPTVAPIGS